MENSRTILVTGGAGFIGSNFIFYMRQMHPDDRIVCLDKLTYAGNLSTLRPLLGKGKTAGERKQPGFRSARGDICDREAVNALSEKEQPEFRSARGDICDREAVNALSGKEQPEFRSDCGDICDRKAVNALSGKEQPEFRFVQGDICDREAVNVLFEEELPDIVVNFAAESHVDRSIVNPKIFLQTNVIGTSVLMDACRKYGTPRFHQVSTDEVYGDLPLESPDLCFTEEMPLRASSPYSASKAGADLLVMAYHRTYDLPVTISRCSNNYGPYQFPEKLIPRMITNALADQPLPVYGQGIHVRDWLYVEDHCRAIDLIIHAGRPGEIYNIGGHNEMQNLDIVRLICRELKKPESLITFVEDRKGHDLRYAIDSSKIQEELGWKPATLFPEGIRKTIRWYLDNRSWWEEILNR